MPRPKKNARRPLKRQRFAGLTVTVQRCKRPGYAAAVVMRRDGRRIRERYFGTQSEAEALAERWSIESGNTGALAAVSITDSDKRQLMRWREILAPFGKTPADAVTFYSDHLKRCKASITIESLSEKLQAFKKREHRSPSYLKDLRTRLGLFCGTFGKRIAADVTTDEISAWLSALSNASGGVENYRRCVGVLFSHAVTLKACASNPVEGSFKPNKVDGEVGILTVSQAAALLAASHNYPEILPATAIGLFAGVRDAELKRLDWRDIRFETGFIEIKGSKAKSARRRLIEMRPVLRAWLAPHRALSGKLWPKQADRGRRLVDMARREAGFGAPGSETEEETENGIKLTRWPSNGMRHSFASYHIAKWQNANALALEMGHTSAALIFAHYRELCLPVDAEAFWNLTPQTVLGEGSAGYLNVVQMTPAA